MALKSKPMDKVRPDVPVHLVAPVEPLARINFNVPKSKRNDWKARASSQGITLTEFIISAVEERMSK